LSVSVDPRIGSELFGYRVEALLGRGGMGVVYKAYDPRLKRYVALKLIAPELSEDERFRERFLAESELAASLDHPNVVPIYDAFDAEGRLAIAMRYVEGTDLKQLLQTERVLDPGRAMAICGQVAAALDAAHARGLIHRDVKPSNVLLAETEHVYLADFGLSRRLAELPGGPEDRLSVGTPSYVSPEQIERGSADGRADQYALGCLLYESLTGQPPFVRDSELAVLWAHVQEEPPAASEHNPDLPIEIDAVIAKAMSKSPDDRYGSCGELVVAASEALGLHRPVTIRDRKALILTAVGVAVVAAAVLAGVLVSEGKGGHPRRPSTKPTLAIKADSVQRIDPATNRLAATIKVGSRPSSVAVGENAVWVTSQGDQTVSRIDPKTDQLSMTSAAGADPTHVVAGERAVWVSNRNDGTLLRLDPRTLKIVQTFYPAGDGHGYCGPAAVGEGAVWVLSKSLSSAGLTRINPDDNLTARVAGVPPCASDVTVGGGAVWLAGGDASRPTRDQTDCSCFALPSASVERVDPVNLKVVASIPLDSLPADIAADGQGVWVVERRDNLLVRIDPKTNQVVGRIKVGDAPFAVATDESSVWVANLDAGTVSRIDPKRDKVVATIKVGPRPTDIAAGEDGIWVIVHPS
jgi:YVTN family beta-propeller protein